ncbi:Protein NRDE2-like protein [Rhynchospora pubera]|uniref:Protein NRDE2-like protein n=1 Tax=Rhynchospora pubera TaxID=906938 RepID=A0AAV8FSH7_9POAL|nr:Protein NRDE2-like protein [Rhynchospora pubera]
MEAPSPEQPETRLTTANTSTSSLFPIFPASSNPTSSLPVLSSTISQWLSNSSFTFDISAIPSATTSAPPAESDEESLESPKDRKPASAKYDLVHSPSRSGSGSGSDGEEEEKRARRKERRKKKKRRRDKDKLRGGEAGSRKSGVQAWTGSGKKPAKDYYFDAKGDFDNLEFGSLYRMDVARYKLQNNSGPSGLHFKFFCGTRPSIHLGEDSDLDGLDRKARSGGRYFSIKYTALERNKGFKHLKLSEKKIPFLLPDEYIPLEQSSLHDNDAGSSEEAEESWEVEVIKKTREFNRRSREFPHDEKIWLSFAEFQDKIARSQPQKAARLQTLEKKISILEKAVELNPDSEDLLICLLRSYRDRDTTEAFLARWERILEQHSDNVRLWKEYLLVRQGEFSRFKVSDVRQIYAYAIQALSSACYKISRQDSQIGCHVLPTSLLEHIELGLADIFVNLCRLEWLTGHKELATGLFQSQIEYSLFSPILNLTPSSKKRLFEHFWNSGGARIGEYGALGWSSWLAKDEERQRNVLMQESSQEVEAGGWSGWFDPRPKESETNTEFNEEAREETSIAEENMEDAPNDENNKTQDDVESLLKMLGIDVDSESHSEVKDAKVWHRWSQEELSRDHRQWMPVRENAAEEEGDEQLSRVILFEDVADYLFSLSSQKARFSLICQFIDLFGGKISQWSCTNNSSWLDKILSLEVVPDQIFEDPRLVNDSTELMSILNSSSDFLRDPTMRKFLKNSIILFLEVFPRNHILEQSLLVLEESLSTTNNSSDLVNPSRSLAKSLLKKDRQDFLLCGIYAQTEAAHGNVDLARKIFDMALLSIEGTPKDFQEKVPLLYFWYTEVEMASNAESSTQRALHILSCLGSNAKYTPFTSPVSGLQILRVRQGFKEQIKSLQPEWACGTVKESAVALVCSASLFETITSGFLCGLEVIEEAFSMILPERRSHSLELECLWEYYIRLVLRHMKQLNMSRIWKSVSQGLHIYPFNPKSFTAMLSLSSCYSVSSKVRLILDKCAQRNPSVVVWLFAISFEWGREGSHNRIQGLFEKALADDKLQKSVLLWRCYLAYEAEVNRNPGAARRVFFRAIHACPWSKSLWLDGFQKLSSILSLKELSDLQEVMRDKELHIRTDIYEILLQDEMEV